MSTIILILAASATVFLALLFFKRVRKASRRGDVSLAEQHDTAKEQTFLLFDLNLPFTPDIHDVIYVEMNKKEKRNATVMGNSTVQPSFWMGLATFIVSAMSWFNK